MKRINAQSGYTLLEMLIAVTLFIVIVVGVISIFISIHRAQTRAEASRILQENLRYATEVMVTEISEGMIDYSRYSDPISNPIQSVDETTGLFLTDYDFYMDNGRLIMSTVGGQGGTELANLTDTSVEVTELTFIILPASPTEDMQEMVTFYLSATSTKEDFVEMDIQTTESTRVYN